MTMNVYPRMAFNSSVKIPCNTTDRSSKADDINAMTRKK